MSDSTWRSEILRNEIKTGIYDSYCNIDTTLLFTTDVLGEIQMTSITPLTNPLYYASMLKKILSDPVIVRTTLSYGLSRRN